jgi:adenosylcobinamide-phosphate synthase
MGGGLDLAMVWAIAAFLDFWIGDPWGWIHPVQVMGWVITRITAWGLRFLKQPSGLRWGGLWLWVGLVLGSGLGGWGLVAIARQVHSLLGLAVEIILLASCLAGRSLRWAATDVLSSFATGDLVATRQRLSFYVGRDTAAMTEAEILRAVLETVTENATDGVFAPLFYALLGGILGLGSVPLALAYKAASTLDSMVGYRDPPYTDWGWFSAKAEDGLTWVPCRCVVMTLALLSGQPRRVWQICQRDAPQDPSPNSGWSECVYAAILGVQMGGSNRYRGVLKDKPLLGDATQPITPQVIMRSLALTRAGVLLWLGGAIGFNVLFHVIGTFLGG